eukprot:NODE_394_length_8135_cov_0.672847.p9 type:complete len:104 gc:universal NODE_394_length_8135_cov_0.672847:7719-8030(+)
MFYPAPTSMDLCTSAKNDYAECVDIFPNCVTCDSQYRKVITACSLAESSRIVCKALTPEAATSTNHTNLKNSTTFVNSTNPGKSSSASSITFTVMTLSTLLLV